MKNLFVVFTLLFTVNLYAQSENTKLSPVEFKANYFKQRGMLVDVRTPEEFEEGHIAGAVNINIAAPDFEKNFEALDRSKPIFLYCTVGGRSAKAAVILRRKGFSKIYDLNGGYTDLLKAGMKSNKEE